MHKPSLNINIEDSARKSTFANTVKRTFYNSTRYNFEDINENDSSGLKAGEDKFTMQAI